MIQQTLQADYAGRFSRNMRQRPGANSKLDAMLDDAQGLLDEQEQADVIYELETQQIQQARLWRTVFGIGAAALSAFFLYAAADQLMSPWEKRYTGELRTVLTKETCAGALFVQGLGLAAAAVSLLTCLPTHAPYKQFVS